MSVKVRLNNLERRNKPTIVNLFPVLMDDLEHGTKNTDELIDPDIHGDFLKVCESQLSDYRERHYAEANS